jgi:diguanylate cyclase (GGDEF)-like protein/PAS domain S-box-containing protein
MNFGAKTRPLLIFLATFLVGLALTLVSWQSSKSDLEELSRRRFAGRIAELQTMIDSRLVAYAQVLRSLQTMVSRSGHPTRQDWDEANQNLRVEEIYPGFTGTIFLRSFSAAERHVVEKETLGFEPEFGIRPAGERDFYAVITAVSPRNPINLKAIGSDSWAHDERRLTLESARDSGETRITAKLNLVIDNTPQPAFLMYQAVYSAGQPPASVKERRARLVGFTGVGYRAGVLMQSILPKDLSDVALQVHDGASPALEHMFFASHPDFDFRAARHVEQKRLSLGGRDWTIIYAALPEFTSKVERDIFHQHIGAGLSLSLVLALLALTLANTRSRAKLLADEMTRSLKESEKRFHTLIESANDAILVCDANGLLTYWNDSAARLFGYSRDEIIGRSVAILVPERLRAAHDTGFAAAIKGLATLRAAAPTATFGLTKDGREVPIEIAKSAWEQGGNPHFAAFIRDNSERAAAEEQIRALAFYDPLTALPNRRLLSDRLNQAIAFNKRYSAFGALMFIDLDNFKTLNDTRGHDIGDLLLIEVAERLKSCVRESDTVGRLGGDEFIVHLENLGENIEQAGLRAQSVAEKIRESIALPYMLKGVEYHSTPSIGLTLFQGQDVTVDGILKQADTAMYQAKNDGRNAIRLFDPVLQVALDTRVALGVDLRKALPNGELRLYYQIQVDSAHRIIGAEVLLRWVHPLRGLVPPGQFIPVAEENGLIVPIGHWVLEAACVQLKTWENDPVLSALRLAVNVSARQFRHVDFVDQVASILEYTKISPSRLKLELTESLVLHDIDDTVAKMKELRNLGISFSMDDFGTGQSSLTYLKRLPLNQLKIDQSFVRDIPGDLSDAVIVQTIIGMGRSLGLDVIAEGVENWEQHDFLRRQGCHAFQGYLFGRPIPGDEFENLVRESEAAE